MSIQEGLSLNALRIGMRVALGHEFYPVGDRTPNVQATLDVAGLAVADALATRGQGEPIADDIITIGRERNRYTFARTIWGVMRELEGVGFEFYARRRFVHVFGDDDARVDELCVDPTVRGDGMAAIVLADWPSYGASPSRIPAIPPSLHDEYVGTVLAAAYLL